MNKRDRAMAKIRKDLENFPPVHRVKISGCDKYRYDSIVSAGIAASYHEKEMFTYKCETCNGWHLTSQKSGRSKVKCI